MVVTGTNTVALRNSATNYTGTYLSGLSDLGIDSNGGPDTDSIDYDDDNMIIKVADNQRYCHIWNTTTDEEIIRSSRE